MVVGHMKWPACSIALLAHVVGSCTSAQVPPPQRAASAGRAPGEALAPNASDGQADRDELAKGESVARHFLGDRPGGAWPAQGYQWLTVGKLYWVMGPAEPARLVAVPGEGQSPVLLTGDLAALKRFLALQFDGRLPGVEALNRVARLIKDAIVGKGGSIATPDFFKSQHDGLGAWLMGRQRDPAELERLCSGIRASLNKNQWTLEFNVLSGAGGVDVVRASGTPAPLTLTNISVGVLKSRGEFSYPPEG
jgi:hypothetical protein